MTANADEEATTRAARPTCVIATRARLGRLHAPPLTTVAAISTPRCMSKGSW